MRNETIIYKGKEYPTRTIDLIIDSRIQTVIIAQEFLSIAFGPDPDKWNDEVHAIDETLYFYLENKYWKLSDKEIAKYHLDEEFELAVL